MTDRCVIHDTFSMERAYPAEGTAEILDGLARYLTPPAG